MAQGPGERHGPGEQGWTDRDRTGLGIPILVLVRLLLLLPRAAARSLTNHAHGSASPASAPAERLPGSGRHVSGTASARPARRGDARFRCGRARGGAPYRRGGPCPAGLRVRLG